MLPPSTTKSKARMITKVPALAPAAKAVARAKSGAPYRLDPSAVRVGCIAWIPFASVIKVTHRDHHKGSSDGVEVVYDASQKTKSKYMAGDGERPRRRAWNHPCVIVRRENNDVWILGLTTYKGRTLEEKLAKYPLETRRKIACWVVPIHPSPAHLLAKDGDVQYQPLTFGEVSGKGKGVGGYVKLSNLYKMDWRDLQTFNGRQRCLDEQSTARLVWLVGDVCGQKWAKGKLRDVVKQTAKKEVGKKKAVQTPKRPGPMRGKQGSRVKKSRLRVQRVKNVKQKLENAASLFAEELTELERSAK